MRRLINRYRQQAGSYRDWVHTVEIVGAGLPAMDVNDDAGCLNERGCLGVFRRQAGSYRESRTLLIFTTHQVER